MLWNGNEYRKTKAVRISRQLFPVTNMLDQKQLENVELFKHLDSMLTNNGRFTCEIKFRISMAKAAFNEKRDLFIGTVDL
jgi:UV DNA damage repair endonuclease